MQIGADMTSLHSASLAALLLAGCALGGGPGEDFDDPERAWAPDPASAVEPYPVQVHTPPSLGVLDTTHTDVNGAPLGIPCATCHGEGADQALVASLEDPQDFHGSLVHEHGELSCESCHDSDRSKLHRADGSLLAMSEAMDLCAQCHGVQKRDYDHATHGGMSGYWDRRQGPQVRNHCLDCHDPHAPATPVVAPVHPPRDRFFGGGGDH